MRQIAEDDGPWLPVAVVDGAPAAPASDRDCLYDGIAGLAPVLAEIAEHRELDAREQELASSIATRLLAQTGGRVEPSLYIGVAGDAVALRLLAPGSESVALHRLVELMTPMGWHSTWGHEVGADAPLTDIIGGTAGIMLTAIWAGGATAAAIAETGGEALLQAADTTDAGLDWGMWPHADGRMPNYSHGTAGVATALAIVGTALGREDFVRAAQLGAQHLLTVGILDEGFVIPHTIPPSSREVEPLTYSWCHGPTGTSYLFGALAHAGVEEVSGLAVADLHRRCVHSVLNSGVPQRLRPGFWDNDGRCCGTAGVGESLLDAAQDSRDPSWADQLLDAACTMADAIVERAIRDEAGARWRFLEYRDEQPLLPPGTSWMQGAAGIAAYLMRLSRVIEHGPSAARVVDRPDQWWAVPRQLRTVRR